MNAKSVIIRGAIASFILNSAFLTAVAGAQIVSHSKNIVIEQPANLPELAQQPGIAFQLYTESGDGSAYLYIEQQNGGCLVVLDVSDPGHVKMVRSVHLAVPGPFDFAQSLGNSSILLRFHNNQGVAVLDLHKAKAPVLKTVDGLKYTGHAEPLGDSAYLMTSELQMDRQAASRDYQVIDASNPVNPSVLYTAKLVNDMASRAETGTTFLLGSDGLTIIRRPSVEDEYLRAQRATN